MRRPFMTAMASIRSSVHARRAMVYLAEIDLRYEALSLPLREKQPHNGDTLLHQLEHCQMRERGAFESVICLK